MPVRQEDRDAAMRLYRWWTDGKFPMMEAAILHGGEDHSEKVKAFATHRETAAQEERAAIVEWLKGMTASEWNAMMDGRSHMPWAWGVAAAIEAGEHRKGGGDA